MRVRKSLIKSYKSLPSKNIIYFLGLSVFLLSHLPSSSQANLTAAKCQGIYSHKSLLSRFSNPGVAEKISEIQQMNTHVLYSPVSSNRFTPDIEHSEHERIQFGDPSVIYLTDRSTPHSLEHTRSLIADHESGFIRSFESEYSALEHLLKFQQNSPEVITHLHQVFQLAKITILKQRAYAAELKKLEQEEKIAAGPNNRNSRAIEFIRGDKLRLILDFRHYFADPLRRSLIEIAPNGILLTNNLIKGNVDNSVKVSVQIYQMLISSILESLNFDTTARLRDFIPERRRH